MSATDDPLRHHVELTSDMRFRVPDEMKEGLEKIAKKRRLKLSTIGREAFGEYIERHATKGRK